MKVTTQGRITIPVGIRTKMGIVPGSEVVFLEDKRRVYLKLVVGSDRGKALITRDTKRFREYFPGLKLLCPQRESPSAFQPRGSYMQNGRGDWI